jgi:predicted O-methyltransferase YrrM
LLTGITYPYVRNKFKGMSTEVKLEDAIEFAFNFSLFGLSIGPVSSLGVSIRPIQVREEITKLLQILKQKSPDSVLEIGTANGGTLFLFSRVASPRAKLVSVDLPGGRFGGGYHHYRSSLYRQFARDGQQIYLLRADSHKRETFEKVYQIFEDKGIDFLFIDGDHTYEGVKEDFEMYSQLVRKGGVVAFHDIVEHPTETGCEVNKFWKEVKRAYEHLELVNDWNQKWAGIGVLYI